MSRLVYSYIEDERKYTFGLCLMLLYFIFFFLRKIKVKVIFVAYGEGTADDQTCQQWKYLAERVSMID